jgi:SecD/SecF fusion protein
MEVSVVDLVRSLSNYSTDSTFTKALRMARGNLLSSQDDFVTLFGQAFEQIDPNAKLAAVFNTIQLRDRIKYNSTNAEVLDVLQAETKIAIDNSVKMCMDILQKKHGFNDKRVSRLVVDKVIVPKGKEHWCYSITENK